MVGPKTRNIFLKSLEVNIIARKLAIIIGVTFKIVSVSVVYAQETKVIVYLTDDAYMQFCLNCRLLNLKTIYMLLSYYEGNILWGCMFVVLSQSKDWPIYYCFKFAIQVADTLD